MSAINTKLPMYHVITYLQYTLCTTVYIEQSDDYNQKMLFEQSHSLSQMDSYFKTLGTTHNNWL